MEAVCQTSFAADKTVLIVTGPYLIRRLGAV